MRNRWISGPWVTILPVINSLFRNHSNATASKSNIKKGQSILNAEKHFPQVMFIKGLFQVQHCQKTEQALCRERAEVVWERERGTCTQIHEFPRECAMQIARKR